MYLHIYMYIHLGKHQEANMWHIFSSEGEGYNLTNRCRNEILWGYYLTREKVVTFCVVSVRERPLLPPPNTHRVPTGNAKTEKQKSRLCRNWCATLVVVAPWGVSHIAHHNCHWSHQPLNYQLWIVLVWWQYIQYTVLMLRSHSAHTLEASTVVVVQENFATKF